MGFKGLSPLWGLTLKFVVSFREMHANFGVSPEKRDRPQPDEPTQNFIDKRAPSVRGWL